MSTGPRVFATQPRGSARCAKARARLLRGMTRSVKVPLFTSHALFHCPTSMNPCPRPSMQCGCMEPTVTSMYIYHCAACPVLIPISLPLPSFVTCVPAVVPDLTFMLLSCFDLAHSFPFWLHQSQGMRLLGLPDPVSVRLTLFLLPFVSLSGRSSPRA